MLGNLIYIWPYRYTKWLLVAAPMSPLAAGTKSSTNFSTIRGYHILESNVSHFPSPFLVLTLLLGCARVGYVWWEPTLYYWPLACACFMLA